MLNFGGRMAGPGRSRDRADEILQRWQAGHSAARIATDLHIATSTVTSTVSLARGRGDARATSRRGGGDQRVSMDDEQRGSLLRLATYCLFDAGAVRLRDVESLLGRPTSKAQQPLARLAPQTGSDASGPGTDLVTAVQRAAHISGRLPVGDALPFPMELAEEIGVLTESATRVPAAWWEDLASEPSATTTAVYALGEAFFTTVEHVDGDDDLARHLMNRAAVEQTLTSVYSVAMQSPRKGARAVHLLGRLGVVALDPSAKHSAFIHRVIYQSPLGYRGMRVASRLLFESSPGTGSSPDRWLYRGVADRVFNLLASVHEDPPPELYPERSFVIEAMFKMPVRDDPDEEARICAWLRDRATDQRRSFRERAYASLVLAGRDAELGGRLRGYVARELSAEPGTDHLLAHLDAVLDDGDLRGAARLTAYPGLLGSAEGRLVERAVENAVGTKEAPGEWSDRRASLRVPTRAVTAVTHLMHCAFADVHGTRRRRAMDTLRHAGLGPFLASAGIEIARTPEAPEWVRAQAAFVVSFSHHAAAVDDLVDLAMDALDGPEIQPRLAVTALHAVGDMGLHLEHAGRGEESLARLYTLAQRLRGPSEPALSRALAYALGNVRTRDSSEVPRLRENLTVLATYSDDRLTRDVAAWGLRRDDARQARSPSKIPDLFVDDPRR